MFCSSTRRRDDQGALALALGRDDVDDARRLVLDGRVERVEPQLFIGIERRQIVEIDAVADHLGIVEIDRCELGQREIALAVLGTAHFALNRVASAQAELADLIGRDIDVVGTGEIIGFRRTQETEAVGQHFDGAQTHDLLAIFSLSLQYGEHQVLLAQRRCPFHPQFLGHGHKVGRCFSLQLFQVHACISGNWDDFVEGRFALFGKGFSCTNGKGSAACVTPDLGFSQRALGAGRRRDLEAGAS